MKSFFKVLLIALISAAAVRMMYVVRLDFSMNAPVILKRDFRMPDAALKKLEAPQQKASSADFPNRPALIVFFGSWCPPCLEEYEDLLKISRLPDAPPIIGIAVRDTPEKIQELFKNKGNAFQKTFLDADMAWSKAMNAPGLPAVFLSDGKGKIAYRIKGRIDEQFFKNKIRPLLQGLAAHENK